MEIRLWQGRTLYRWRSRRQTSNRSWLRNPAHLLSAPSRLGPCGTQGRQPQVESSDLWSDRFRGCCVAKLSGTRQVSSDPQRIRYPVDVVEPGSNQGDLKNSAVIKPHRAKSIMVRTRALSRIPGKFHDVVQHHPLLIGDSGSLSRKCNPRFAMPPRGIPRPIRHSTQKLLACRDSMQWKATVGHRTFPCVAIISWAPTVSSAPRPVRGRGKRDSKRRDHAERAPESGVVQPATMPVLSMHGENSLESGQPHIVGREWTLRHAAPGNMGRILKLLLMVGEGTRPECGHIEKYEKGVSWEYLLPSSTWSKLLQYRNGNTAS